MDLIFMRLEMRWTNVGASSLKWPFVPYDICESVSTYRINTELCDLSSLQGSINSPIVAATIEVPNRRKLAKNGSVHF